MTQTLPLFTEPRWRRTELPPLQERIARLGTPLFEFGIVRVDRHASRVWSELS
jgi:hypothetical protein